MQTLKQTVSVVWAALRELSGDDAYERYLKHHTAVHPGKAPLDRASWFREEQKRKWDGIRRCC
ncbi:MAG TPA: YbdD/YjiX family protein [Candidatus Acidoferrum sp.]|nr:YbdD/YjiX family protein [Candidatus Acidoferrum sp.]